VLLATRELISVSCSPQNPAPKYLAEDWLCLQRGVAGWVVARVFRKGRIVEDQPEGHRR